MLNSIISFTLLNDILFSLKYLGKSFFISKSRIFLKPLKSTWGGSNFIIIPPNFSIFLIAFEYNESSKKSLNTPNRFPFNEELIIDSKSILFFLTEKVSSWSNPEIAFKTIALSITFLVIGPDVSRVLEIGTIPDLLTKPIVGFRPTIEFAEDGESIDPDVSEPSDTLEKFAEIATPLPELDPPESNFFLPYGFKV